MCVNSFFILSALSYIKSPKNIIISSTLTILLSVMFLRSLTDVLIYGIARHHACAIHKSIANFPKWFDRLKRAEISMICRFIAYVHLHNKTLRFQTTNFTFIVSLLKNANCIFMLNTLSSFPYLALWAPWPKTRALIKPWIQYSSNSEAFIKRLSHPSLRIIKYFVKICFWQMLCLMCSYTLMHWKGGKYDRKKLV